MIRRPPRSTRTDTLFPYTTLFRSLQLPALFGGRGRPLRRAGPPRSGPWQVGVARVAPGAADGRGVPLHDPRAVGPHRVQRILVHGDGVRRLAVDDGRGRSAAASGVGHRSEERRVGKGGVSTGRSRWSLDHIKKTRKKEKGNKTE